MDSVSDEMVVRFCFQFSDRLFPPRIIIWISAVTADYLQGLKFEFFSRRDIRYNKEYICV